MSFFRQPFITRLTLLFTTAFSLSLLPFIVSGQAGWQSVSSGIVNPYNATGFYVLATSGNIVYASIGATVYKWAGNGWTELGTGPVVAFGSSGQINSIITDGTGNVYAAGWFTNANGNYYVAKWDGKAWSELGTGTNALNALGEISTMTADASGNIYATGNYTNNIAQFYVAKWNGNKWSELKSSNSALNANGNIECITTDPAGNVYVAGDFTDANKNKYVAKWDGFKWSEIGVGSAALNANSYINSIAVLPNGNIYTAGYFTNANGYPYVAKWDGSKWSALANIPNAYAYFQFISSLQADAAGNIYAVGGFTDQNHYSYIAEWNGASWAELGAGAGSLNANGGISSIAFDKAGDIFASGTFKNNNGLCYVAEWNKTTNGWSQLGINGAGELPNFSSGYSVAIASPNNIYALNSGFDFAGQIFQWNGIFWGPIPMPAHDPYSTYFHLIQTDAKGNLYLSGSMGNSSYFGKWDGAKWIRIDTIGGFSNNNLSYTDFVQMVTDPVGNIYGLGRFSYDSGIIVKWDGSVWSLIKYSTTSSSDRDEISSIAVDASGNLYAGLYTGYETDSYYIGEWNGSNWLEIGTTSRLSFSSDEIGHIAIDKYGNIYANVGGIYQSNFVVGIKKWDGNNWVHVGTYTDFFNVSALTTDANGNLYAGVFGQDYKLKVVELQDTVWVEAGENTQPLNANGGIDWLGTDSYSNVYAMGGFTNSNGYRYLARYGSNGVLPIKVINFTGYLNKGNAILNWQTAQEINAGYFNVQRSTDGIHFITVGKVMASGNSSALLNYSYSDLLSALDTSISKIYYRLAEVDKDGATAYTNIVRLIISNNNNKWGFKIYPVPVKNTLQLQLINTTGKCIASIFDAQGKKVDVREIGSSNAGNIPVDVSALKAGLYFLNVLYNGESKTVKFVKY